MILPCPICSHVVRNGDLREAVGEYPMWSYARNTSVREKATHWIWCGCKHAVGTEPPLPVVDKEPTEAAWNEKALKLLEAHTRDWPEHVRNEFKRVLGYVPEPAPELFA